MTEEEMNRFLGVETSDEVDELAKEYEDGTWDGSDLEAVTHYGRPPLLGQTMQLVSFRETPEIVQRLDQRATSLGVSRSTYLRGLVQKDLALTN